MAGHSHWAGIKRRKQSTDSKRGRVFSRIARQIMSAARTGGSDPDANLQLKYAIEHAKQVSMPKDTVERAIKKGTGELEGTQLESVMYEAIGPGAVFVLIEALTDNRNRTAAEIRKILELKDAHLGKVAWAFEQKGLIVVSAESVSEDALLEAVLEAGADDMQRVGASFEVVTAPVDLERVRRSLEEKGIPMDAAELTQLPKSPVPVDEHTGRKLLSLLQELDDHDDVESVYSNLDLPESLLAEVS